MVNGIAAPDRGREHDVHMGPGQRRGAVPCRTQFFEILGNRAMYHDGWFAGTTPPSPPWDSTTPRPADVVNGYRWELYNLRDDPTQVNDLAAKEPERLRTLQESAITSHRYTLLSAGPRA